MIEDRNLAAGTKLVARYKGKDYRCQVIDTKEGIRYQLGGLNGNQIVKSPSKAGSIVMDGSACNGWRFWSLEGQEPKPRQRKAKTKPNGNPGFQRMEDGRFWCEACAEAFDAPKDVTPVGCPKGHSPDGDATKAAKPKKEAVSA